MTHADWDAIIAIAIWLPLVIAWGVLVERASRDDRTC